MLGFVGNPLGSHVKCFLVKFAVRSLGGGCHESLTPLNMGIEKVLCQVAATFLRILVLKDKDKSHHLQLNAKMILNRGFTTWFDEILELTH